MTLQVHTQGAGPDLVLLHGWAMHAGVFDQLLPELHGYRLHNIDLPGHGRSAYHGELQSLTRLAMAVQPHVPENAIVLGWSLGAPLALQLARAMKLRALILVSATPKFVADDTWLHGMSPKVFEQFFARLQQHLQATVQDFLSLQVRGDAHAAAALTTLKAGLLRHAPQPQALHDGLALLRDTDLRLGLSQIHPPTLVLAGEYDRITHPHASEYLARHLPQAQFALCKRAGHAPFLSDTPWFVMQLRAFIAALHP